jgi:non-specific serine/threonine protein kinase
VVLPWYAAVVIAVVALLAGAAIAAWLFAIAERPAGAHVPAAVAQPAQPGPESAVFRLEGAYWTIAFKGPTFRLIDAKGLRYVHRLLETPGVEVHVLDLELLGLAGATSPPAAEDGLHAGFPAGQLLVDQETLRRYRLRIEDLRDQIEEAEATNDPERAGRAREELEYLMEELDKVTHHGKPRIQAGETERARVNVYRAIHSSIGKIREQDASLGHHLDHDIRTGTYCSYAPDPTTAPAWAL